MNGQPQARIKRLFFDIEVSPNTAFIWQTGHKIQVGYENIIREREIICICWKWEGMSKVNYLAWDKKQSDKQLVKKFIGVMNEADEIIGHNGDRFDLAWLRTRAAFHGFSMIPDYKTIDTLKVARGKFKFNSNRLDYLGQFFGVGKKMDNGGFGLWKDIMLKNCNKSLNKMIDYCKQDVILLEKVYDKMSTHIKPKTHIMGEGICPECGGEHYQRRGTNINANGNISIKLQCQDCGKWWSMPEKRFNNLTK